VLGERLLQFGDQAVFPAGEPLVVGGAQADAVGVRHQGAAAADDGGGGVGFTTQGAHQLDGLHLTAEGLGEGSRDCTFDTMLESVQDSHRTLLSSFVPVSPPRLR
jgi:hypothetical protein